MSVSNPFLLELILSAANNNIFPFFGRFNASLANFLSRGLNVFIGNGLKICLCSKSLKALLFIEIETNHFEGATILMLGRKNGGNYKDNPHLIESQMQRYLDEGYPKDNGLVVQMEVLRRHNEQDVVDAMEHQWVELKYNSKREQLSFNYIAWKNKLKFSYIQGDSRDNKYFLNMGAHTGKK